MPEQYSEYIKRYPIALDAIRDCLIKSHLPHLENVTLRLSHALEENILDLKDGNEKIFLTSVLVKTVNELFATIGSIKYGGLLACYHHSRSIFELLASLEHVYSNPSKRKRKLEKFIEYQYLARYLHYLSWKDRLSTGEITKEQFDHGCRVSEEDFRGLLKRISEWQRIWKIKGDDPDLSVIQNWHYPATIEGLFKSSTDSNGVWDTYELICHATHLSPLGERLTGGHFLMGFPRNGSDFDYQKINQAIDGAILGAQKVALCLYKKINAGLIQGIFDWVPGDVLA